MEDSNTIRTLEKYTNMNEPQYDFIHFNTQYDCERHLINNIRINVAYLCCEGKGIAIHRKNKMNGMSCKEIFIPIDGTCDICFEETTLFNTCNTCRHPFCKPCLQKIKDKVCPYCRGKLKNNFD